MVTAKQEKIIYCFVSNPDKTLYEIADEVGCNFSYVSDVLKKYLHTKKREENLSVVKEVEVDFVLISENINVYRAYEKMTKTGYYENLINSIHHTSRL